MTFKDGFKVGLGIACGMMAGQFSMGLLFWVLRFIF